jgi:CheY-like chemotaxis protein
MDAPCPPKPRTVLVVEDDDVTRAFLLDNFAADGFRVAGASAAGEGLRAMEVRQPALVVLDLLLDDGSGLALLDRVRASDGLSSRIDPDVPVIVLSGRAGDADRVRSFARGADDHLSKPSCRFRQRGIPLVERASSPVGAFDRDVLVRGRKRSESGLQLFVSYRRMTGSALSQSQSPAHRLGARRAPGRHRRGDTAHVGAGEHLGSGS